MSNLVRFWRLVEADDMAEGRQAYCGYHQMMRLISDRYAVPFDVVVACFAALSPQNDYIGNVRSVISVIEGWQAGKPRDRITVSTFGACRDRALTYLDGVSFLDTVKGPKIRAFYHNIIDPDCVRHITIDGHMVAIHRGNDGTMKENIVRPSEYRKIAADFIDFAHVVGMIPNQLQASFWFARKRVLRVKYVPQYDLFAPGDLWRTVRPLSEFPAYS